jgi:23S rRNA (guanosine2251-2'-O)-methyltransferase
MTAENLTHSACNVTTPMTDTDNPRYTARKTFFDSLLTVYGRKPVHEALATTGSRALRLHLAQTNRPTGIIADIIALAESQQVEICYHSREALARISKNGRQDQGVAVDIEAPRYRPLSQLLQHVKAHPDEAIDLIALDRVTNPQNLGLIIRAVGASPCVGLLLPKKGCARIDPLVIKASAGTVLKVPIYYCDELIQGMAELADAGFRLIGLAADGNQTIPEVPLTGRHVFVLGNETDGLSPEIKSCCDACASIPLTNDVESLNVSTAASIVAYRRIFQR